MANKTYHRFTEAEDKVILDKISKNPSNLTEAFIAAALELNLTKSSIANRWYRALSKKNFNTKSNATFVTYGKKQINVNRKVSRIGTQQPVELKQSPWRKILDFIFGK